MTTAMFKCYSNMVRFLGQVLGSDFQIMLYDKTENGCRLVSYAGLDANGVQLGSELQDEFLRHELQKRYHRNEIFVDYRLEGKPEDKRASAMLLKDGKKNVFGVLIMVYNTARTDAAIQALRNLFSSDNSGDENFVSVSFVDSEVPTEESPRVVAAGRQTEARIAARQQIEEVGLPVDTLTQEDKIEIVQILDKQGIFLIKNAVKDVADELHSSGASIYRYLSQIHRK